MALQKQECASERSLVLVGLVDLNPVFRDMLLQVADKITAIVFTDDDHRDWFDDLGCLDVERWQQARIPIEDSMILMADQPADCAPVPDHAGSV